ncbi:MAG: class I SAM-dependent methyltransferase [Candidatus Thorarchaeota archaeon]
MSHHHGKGDWSDPDFVKRMAQTYNVRYDDSFWNAFSSLTTKEPRPIVADFGCGPGLLLVDIANRFNADVAIALDESEEMLNLAEVKLKERTNLKSIDIHLVNFDTEEIRIAPATIDFAFSGFMLHEVAGPSDFASKVFRLIKPTGVYMVYDFISGNEDVFVRSMVEHGMSEEKARKRYPHMCRHSADEITQILETSGFSETRAKLIDEIRAVVVGLKR